MVATTAVVVAMASLHMPLVTAATSLVTAVISPAAMAVTFHAVDVAEEGSTIEADTEEVAVAIAAGVEMAAASVQVTSAARS